ncbi:MAG TPA: hypothetical protein PKN96_01415 [Flavobacterium sp.]|uniref:hypothetical protein n=1 Tax=Flavobacterium sp. TaxID=239 RepID=UPI002CB00F08|nr:hypothetical protein [Flavobacterium sp.]HNP31931.1 hypothetical protein [Flavobacterium sp.]
MATTIKTASLYQFLFAICLVIPYFNIYELTFVVWSMSALITLQKNYSLSILKQLACFAAILLIAVVVMFFKDHQTYFIIRDFTYVVKPVFGLLIGYQLCKKFPGRAFQTIIYIALFIAAYHFFLIATGILLFKTLTVNDLRFYAGYFSDFEVYALIILVFHKKFGLKFSRKKTLLYTVIITISTFMYLARTNFIQFVILFMALKGYFEVNRRLITVLITFITVTAIGYSAILYINPKRNGAGIEAFLYKIKVAPIEPFKTKINRENWKDLNDNYRSYENIMTTRQVSRDGFYSILFGQGLGSQVDLKQKIWLGDMELRYISILHNGFMTVFLKSGLLGVFFLLMSIFLLFRLQKTDVPIIQQINYLMVGSGLFLFVSYWVFMGYYFVADTKAIVIGFLICYRELVLKNDAKLLQND